MRLQSHKAFGHQLSEVSKPAALKTPHHVYHLLRQLERRLLHGNALAWRITEKESKVYVDYMPLDIHQDVAVVSVFNLEDVADQTVSCQT